MKYIKIKDTVIVFDVLLNHAFIANLLGDASDVQSAGFVQLVPSKNNAILSSAYGRSTTLKINSDPVDSDIVEEHFKMSAECPINFISSDSTLIFFPKSAPFDVVEAMKNVWPGAEFVHGAVWFDTLETDDFRYDSGYKAVPHFQDTFGTIGNDLLFTIDCNVRSR
jgi:hypothetical protein